MTSTFALRALLAIFVFCVGFAAWPQQRPRVIGYLSMLDTGARDRCSGELMAALQQLGWREGSDVRLLVAHAGRDEAMLPQRARELVAARPDVLVSAGLNPVSALRTATRQIPIVALGTGFLQGSKLIESLRDSGTNVTGISLGDSEHGIKSLELLTQLMPGVRRVGLLHNRNNPAHRMQPNPLTRAAERLGLDLTSADFSGFGDLEPAWRRLAGAGVEAVFIQPDLGMYVEEHARMSRLLRLPAMTHHQRFAASGGAFAYGYTADFCPRGARYVDRILRGAQPRELPLEEVWDVGLTVNLRTVRELRIRVASAAISRASRIIE